MKQKQTRNGNRATKNRLLYIYSDAENTMHRYSQFVCDSAYFPIPMARPTQINHFNFFFFAPTQSLRVWVSLSLFLIYDSHSPHIQRKNYVIGMKWNGGKIDCSPRFLIYAFYSVYVTRFSWHFFYFTLHQRRKKTISFSLHPHLELCKFDGYFNGCFVE